MVEKLWDSSALKKNPQYQALMDEVAVLNELLLQNQDIDGKANLRHMANAYTHLEEVVILTAFQQGFSMAVYLVIEALRSQDRR